MKRRAFLAAAAASLIGAPRLVRAQQEPRRVALTHSVRPLSDLMPDGDPRFAAYHDEMRRLGWIEGVNLVTEYWSGAGVDDRDDWVRQIYASKPDVVVFGGYSRLVPQLLREVGSVPTIIVGADPLAAGLVTSLARPGGSITGFSVSAGHELSGKQLQLLSEAVQGTGRVAYFGPRHYWGSVEGTLQTVAMQLGVTIEPALYEPGAQEPEVRRVFAAMAATGPDALLSANSAGNNAHARQLAEMALAARLPGIAEMRSFTRFGLLMSYGPDGAVLRRRSAGYVDRILRGEKPGDLPIQQPTAFNLIVNMSTARTLGIAIPPKIMLQASELIE